ncbi:hypothetical protein B0A50_06094 [Salinomyces thailandicus]|uniref:ERCC1-like central domain-containing protein n=1 Tax=Salinomyces thailandicus TaxID=706561 RepID=A0A4U0TSS4_9PEZI|nr:hypothetical protein B0A50_06094 [Salinomyces thailandica]
MADERVDNVPGAPRQAAGAASSSGNRLNGSSTNATRPNNDGASGPRTTAGLDRASASGSGSGMGSGRPGVQQPKPQALPKRSGPASIIVSPRQKGNPILNHIKSLPWEYGDIPADYVLGLTTAALFLSLKYHRLHPEYIYTRIKQLQGKYNLRIVLCMVDIQNHEESLKELSKTSLINNVTIILCWSAAEGGRYLELFKTYENAAPTSIKQHQSTSYADRLVDFVTTPRSINKTDAVSLVSQFGSIRTAVNARHEDVATIAGWGDKKVQAWCKSVREPFRIQRAAKRSLARDDTLMSLSQPVSRAGTLSRDVTHGEEGEAPRPNSAGGMQARSITSAAVGSDDAAAGPRSRRAEQLPVEESYTDDESALAEATTDSMALPPKQTIDAVQEGPPAKRRKKSDEDLGEGVMAALSKLRKNG